jgi:NAD(P)-dependent dehydrogenase (short-subunit alcohol dehydrogenase family)
VSKVAIVTGAGSGIGAALSRALVARGDTVVLADIDVAMAASVAEALGTDRARPVGLDVRDASAVAALIDFVVAEHGRLDLLFNNAGVGMRGELQDVSLEHWNRVIDVNVRGVVHGVAAAYPVMLAQGSGHIVNTASLAGLCPSPLLAAYSTTKHAVVGLSRSLRAEAAMHGVRVTVVCPGPVDTPFLDKGGPEDLPPTPLRQHLDLRAMLTRGGPVYSAGDVARDILAGVDRNRALVVTPRQARVAWWMDRWVPGVLDRVTRKGSRNVLSELRKVQPSAQAPAPAGEPAGARGADSS